ncbi:MAG: hypothetical protein JO130_11360 [Solirubrobacterales bacterium]|nr:hypothetical protein [Solirubrobacterales bacterium]
MLKATVGTWINYGTTAFFQVLFARRFGSTPDASAYALTFTLAISIAAIFVGVTQVMFLPRLLTRGGKVSMAVVRRLARMTALGMMIFAVLAAGASLLAPIIAPKLNDGGTHLVELVRAACVFGFSQVVVAQLAAVAWARGRRFVPAVSPAIPSIVASVPLIANPNVTPLALYVLLTLGGLLQIVLLTFSVRRDLQFVREPLDREGETSVSLVFGTYAAAQLIAPFELFVAAHWSTSGGADFNYAYRGIVVAQSLIVGGVVFAALPDWSNHVRAQARATLERSIARTLSMAALALSLAAAVGLVAANTLVSAAFQRGSFTAHDTRAVSEIVVAGLLGFVAEGVMLVLSQALLADRRNRVAVIIALARSFGLIILVAGLGLTLGPVGVALGYSIANVVALAVQLVYACREGMLTSRQLRLARSTAVVTVCTCGAAAMLIPLHVPSPVAAAVVIGVFATTVLSVRNSLPSIRVRV